MKKQKINPKINPKKVVLSEDEKVKKSDIIVGMSSISGTKVSNLTDDEKTILLENIAIVLGIADKSGKIKSFSNG